MACIRSAFPAMLAVLAAAGGIARAQASGPLDDAALKAYAAQSFDPRAMMGRTVELGRHHGVPVVAEFPCSDVCPQYTVRIIHYRLPPDTDCAAAGGVERTVPVPVAIASTDATFCVPKVLAGGGYYRRAELTPPRRRP
ncbi:hypothetical protein QMK61_09655 [Fulvimonas sp. R45]|uniref:hypothetical protein n=1 Tax=Fulvimonas sp. R45 TaxID=3045937 RepID=UPI00265EACCE|nr:hypothetical protein [Fulvimonas sp. R45]MDO1529090.1 hypothetical protein [Fulvimonas sp. R45]